MKKLLTEREIEQEYGIPVRTLQKWRHEGGGPEYVKFKRSVRYIPHVVEEFIQSRVRTSTSDQGPK